MLSKLFNTIFQNGRAPRNGLFIVGFLSEVDFSGLNIMCISQNRPELEYFEVDRNHSFKAFFFSVNFQNGAHLPSYNGSHCDTNYSFDRTSWKWTIHRCFEQKRNSTQGKFFTNSHRSFHFRHHIHFCLGSNFLHEVSSLGLARVDQQGSGQKVNP